MAYPVVIVDALVEEAAQNDRDYPEGIDNMVVGFVQKLVSILRIAIFDVGGMDVAVRVCQLGASVE
jgi:hypothetical protein